MIGCSACSNKPNERMIEYIPYEQLPVNYSLKNAKSDGCVVFENSRLTSGDDIWKKFIEKQQAGEAARVRLAYYYTLDSHNLSKEYYEQIKDDYPVLYIHDLSFEGEAYKLYFTEGKQAYEYEYPYLVRYTGAPSSSSATYSRYVRYFLVRDKEVTYEKIEHGWLSSQSGDKVDCMSVYTDLIQ
jgi:hypothetical protein